LEDIVLYEKSGDIGKIILNKLEERNTITLDVLKKLIELFEMSAENIDVCVIYAAKDKQCLSVHSLSFIKYISSMAKVIQVKDPIKFNIRNDNPLRAEIELDSSDNIFIAQNSKDFIYSSPSTLNKNSDDTGENHKLINKKPSN